MKKVLMIVDSYSGLNKKQAEKEGYLYIPQLVTIDGKEYRDGDNIIMENAVELIENYESFKTSAPPVGEIMNVIEENASKYDYILYWPMNKGITSTYNTVRNITNDYDNVFAIDTKMYCAPLLKTIKNVKRMLEKDKTMDEVFAYIKKNNDATIEYLVPKNVNSMIKGGRLKGAKKIIMEKGKLIPKMKFTDNGIRPTAFKRNFGKLVRKTVQSMASDLHNPSDYEWQVIHTGDFSAVKIAEEELASLGLTNTRNWIPAVVTVHMGVGGIGISAFPKIEMIK